MAAPSRAPTATVPAAVSLPDGTTEVRDLPGAGPGSGWLRVLGSGVCGTDVALAQGGLTGPTVLGHHVVGVVETHRELDSGALVVLEEYLPCGTCDLCRAGDHRFCPETDFWAGGRRIGTLPADEAGPSGGNAARLRLPPTAVMHRVPDGLDPLLAVWAQPFGNALDWVLGAGALAAGETLVVLGPGYHGVAAVAAGIVGGAGRVVVAGRAQDRERLAVAADLGAVPVDGNDLAARVADLTGGRMADVVLDATGSGSVARGLDLLGLRGRLVLSSPTTPPSPPLDTAAMTRRTLTVRSVRGRSPARLREALDLLAAGRSGLEGVPTAEVPLAGVGDLYARLAAGDGPATPHVVVVP